MNKNYINKLHKNIDISENEVNRLKKLFSKWDNLILRKSEMYFKYNWKQFVDKNSNFGTNPPWGKLVAIDLVSGKKIWENVVGSYVGTPIYGGIASNLGDLIVLTGTSDNKVYFFDQKDGKILNEIQMEGPGTAPPLIYNNKNGSNILIITNGMHYPNFDKNSKTIVYNFNLN